MVHSPCYNAQKYILLIIYEVLNLILHKDGRVTSINLIMSVNMVASLDNITCIFHHCDCLLSHLSHITAHKPFKLNVKWV